MIEKEDPLYKIKTAFINQFREDRSKDNQAMNLIDELIYRFSPEARNYLSFLTSIFLEQDVYKNTFRNPDEVARIKNEFNALGVSNDAADIILDFLKQDKATPK